MATLENLPEEVIVQILLRLPPDSVAQFKSVSKFWYALINDPKISCLLQQQLILFKRLVPANDNSGKKQLRLSIVALHPSMSVLDDVPLPFPFPFDDQKLENLEIHGLSHGLVCLTDCGRIILLCNPTTREFRKLPSSIIQPTDLISYFYDTTAYAVGFGYDSKSRDFKVVRVVGFVGSGYYNKAEIYDLSKDRWREYQIPNSNYASADICLCPSFEIYHEGTYYWGNIKFRRHIILSFDMSEEVFGDISLPESFEDGQILDVGVLNGSIVMFHYPWQGNEKAFDIWEMDKDDESGGGVSWSKLFTIGTLFGIDRPLLFLSFDQLLMVSNEGNVILYNIKTQLFKTLPLPGDWFQATFYVKSLLSVKRRRNINSTIYGF